MIIKPKMAFPYSIFFEYQVTLDGKFTHYRRILRLEKYIDAFCALLCRFRRPPSEYTTDRDDKLVQR